MNDFKQICIYNRNNATYMNNTVKGICKPLGVNTSYLKSTFYALDSNVRPIPTFMYIISIQLSKQFPYNILSIRNVYDPFEERESDIEFITWLTPVPFTTPLYIYEGNIGLYVSFDVKTDMIEIPISPIYVFKDKPILTYSNYLNRCIPDINSKLTIRECNNHKEKPLSILDIIKTDKKTTTHTPYKLYYSYICLMLILILFKINLI